LFWFYFNSFCSKNTFGKCLEKENKKEKEMGKNPAAQLTPHGPQRSRMLPAASSSGRTAVDGP